MTEAAVLAAASAAADSAEQKAADIIRGDKGRFLFTSEIFGGGLARAEGHRRALTGGKCARRCAPCRAEAPAPRGRAKPGNLKVHPLDAEAVGQGIFCQVPAPGRAGPENGPATGEKASKLRKLL
jgi:hypothetical protein